MLNPPSVAVIIIPYDDDDDLVFGHPVRKFYGHVATNPILNAFGKTKEDVLHQIREKILTNQIGASKRNLIEVVNLTFEDLAVEQVHNS
jgi:hypothetical protein